MSILEQVQDDVKTAMKAGEKERVGQLRMVVNALQTEEKEGKGDEVAALQRERKRRLDAAEALREGGRAEGAAAEEAGASEPKDMGGVMKVLMPKVGGRADGKRVSQAVREKLGA